MQVGVHDNTDQIEANPSPVTHLFAKVFVVYERRREIGVDAAGCHAGRPMEDERLQYLQGFPTAM